MTDRPADPIVFGPPDGPEHRPGPGDIPQAVNHWHLALRTCTDRPPRAFERWPIPMGQDRNGTPYVLVLDEVPLLANTPAINALIFTGRKPGLDPDLDQVALGGTARTAKARLLDILTRRMLDADELTRLKTLPAAPWRQTPHRNQTPSRHTRRQLRRRLLRCRA